MAVEISGTEVLLSDIEKMVPKDADIDSCLIAGADIITEEIRNRAPSKSGTMKAAISTGAPKTGKRGRYVTSGIHRKDFVGEDYYPAYVEYGHGGPHPAPPHQFIRPAYDTKKEEAWAAVKSAALAQLREKGL